MDEAIRKLKSTTFSGRRLTRRQIADVQCTVRDFPKLSRYELGHTICEHLNLHTPRGGNRVRTAQRLLERLEELGILTLPEKGRIEAAGGTEGVGMDRPLRATGGGSRGVGAAGAVGTARDNREGRGRGME